MSKVFWGVIMLLAVGAFPIMGEAKDVASWNVYEMRAVYVKELSDHPVMYVIGFNGFLTLPAIKESLSGASAGSIIKLDKGSCIPSPADPLGTAEAMKDFQAFCKAKKF